MVTMWNDLDWRYRRCLDDKFTSIGYMDCGDMSYTTYGCRRSLTFSRNILPLSSLYKLISQPWNSQVTTNLVTITVYNAGRWHFSTQELIFHSPSGMNCITMTSASGLWNSLLCPFGSHKFLCFCVLATLHPVAGARQGPRHTNFILLFNFSWLCPFCLKLSLPAHALTLELPWIYKNELSFPPSVFTDFAT